MCMCGKPTINGQPGYRWNTDEESVHGILAPTPEPDDTVLYDEPGRCGGIDCHSHHLTMVKNHGTYYLLYRHGGGQGRIELSRGYGLDCMENMDTHARYWLMWTIYRTHEHAERTARDGERVRWTSAALQKRIKTSRRGTKWKVWIVPESAHAA